MLRIICKVLTTPLAATGCLFVLLGLGHDFTAALAADGPSMVRAGSYSATQS